MHPGCLGGWSLCLPLVGPCACGTRVRRGPHVAVAHAARRALYAHAAVTSVSPGACWSGDSAPPRPEGGPCTLDRARWPCGRGSDLGLVTWPVCSVWASQAAGGWGRDGGVSQVGITLSTAAHPSVTWGASTSSWGQPPPRKPQAVAPPLSGPALSLCP